MEISFIGIINFCFYYKNNNNRLMVNGESIYEYESRININIDMQALKKNVFH